ncbi:MAG: cytochrome C peroxidase, partial [Pseudomonadota bacterium]
GLRNVALTAPYMHDGSRATLRDAIALYEDRDDLGVTLEDDDFGDIETFLRTLSDNNFPQTVPNFVPSQLPVGGDIQ